MGFLEEHVGDATAGGYVDPETADRLEAEYYATHPHTLDVVGRAELTYHQLDALQRVVEEKVVLAPTTIVSAGGVVQPGLTFTTIVPEMPTPYVPDYLAGKARYSTVPGVFSPAPFSIVGIGSIIGTLLIKHGAQLLVEIPIEVLQGPALGPLMQRIGQKAARNVGLRVRTNAGEGRGRHMNIRGRDGASPGDQHDAYDEPDGSTWFQPWTWL